MKKTSLRTRVSLLLGFVILTMSGLDFLASHWSMQRSLSAYSKQAEQRQVKDWASILTLLYDEHGYWDFDGVIAHASTIRIDGANLGRVQFVLVAPKKRYSHTTLPSSQWLTWPQSPIYFKEKRIATLYLKPYPPVGVLAVRHQIASDFDLAEFFIILLTVAGALACSTWVVRRSLFPLYQLSQAAVAMTGGNYDVELPRAVDNEVLQLVTAFSRMQETLAKARKAREKALDDIHHELRTPMNVISNRMEAIHLGLYTWDQQSAAILHREVVRMQRILDDLQQVHEVMDEDLTLHPEWIEVNDWLSELLSLFAADSHVRGVSLQLDIAPSVVMLWGDKSKLSQVVVNLVSNALRFSPAGGLVRVGISEDENQFYLEVSDDGPGIPERHLPFIFHRFYQVESAPWHEHTGTGLGLAIVREIILAHHGDVFASSEIDKGTTVHIKLPRCPSSLVIPQTNHLS